MVKQLIDFADRDEKMIWLQRYTLTGFKIVNNMLAFFANACTLLGMVTFGHVTKMAVTLADSPYPKTPNYMQILRRYLSWNRT